MASDIDVYKCGKTMFAALKWEGGEGGGGREKETDLKLEKNFPVALNSLQDLLSTGCLQLVKSTAMLA